MVVCANNDKFDLINLPLVKLIVNYTRNHPITSNNSRFLTAHALHGSLFNCLLEMDNFYVLPRKMFLMLVVFKQNGLTSISCKIKLPSINIAKKVLDCYF